MPHHARVLFNGRLPQAIVELHAAERGTASVWRLNWARWEALEKPPANLRDLTRLKRLAYEPWRARPVITYKRAFLSGHNSVLLDLDGAGGHMFVCDAVFTFKTTEPVLRFQSPMGNSLVPYSVAWTRSHCLLLTERVMVPREAVRGAADPYQVYYQDERIGKPLKGLRVLLKEVSMHET